MKKNRKLIYLSLLSAIGIVLGLFESVIPIPVAIPGARLGLSNIVVLVTIVAIGYKEGFFVSIFKTIILGIVTGAVSSFFFSIGGAILSSISMILAHKFLRKYLSLIGISEIGSFFHNLGQVLVACFIMKTTTILAYLPLLVILGIFTGYFVGLASIYIVDNTNILK
ncbi:MULTISPECIES: Gx transporter family protein [Peptoniphilus]|jgi:heptaprenyl diphosphate synthase component I|uniref:Gx transporter family protein n=1 Tax=Peptoniphilus TaxID=162289 RepID=UPI00028A0832|nr:MULTISPECIES: Gx transporter family protein [Peptoniphilus]MBS6610616.1 Gx transporter family protein [Peptoniphilus harei]MDU1044009.1 Gx transporter family protein [Peptoniphilus rhinitidis]MDU1954636.1 Gx transporter family protein [Peptoniphilus lacydonensis]MDU3750741.1 Gx transporter family protein [Peptoniphilus rhinitidis]MDU5275217.1 Gx transporter family protein [Peptoniphilus lacydonensis]